MTRRMGMLMGALLLVCALSDLGAQEKQQKHVQNEVEIPYGPIEGFQVIFQVIAPGAAFRDFGIRIGKSIPNQCPVCRTMAPPYRRPRGVGDWVPCRPPSDNVVCVGPGEPYGPTERIVRCRRCNAAFWQDAEVDFCEELREFDAKKDYTLIPYRGKPAADGPRYKAIGNSMAVPVMRWIGQRIEAMERITK